ncbi:Clp protease (plasmid) [Serratia sp. JSRIV006]|nr:Clp protease [Serratia sp. JSRIV006]
MGVEVVRVFLAHADVSQLKEQYSGEAGETFAKAIHENCTARVSLKQNKEHK